MGGGESGEVVRGAGRRGGAGGVKSVGEEWGEGGGKRGGGDWGGFWRELAGLVRGSGAGRGGGGVAGQISAVAVGEVAEFAVCAAGHRDWGKRTVGNFASKEWGGGGGGETNSEVGSSRGEVGGGGSDNGEWGGGGGMGMGDRKMRTREEWQELVRVAVAETLRRKEPILDGQRLMGDLGAESIDRIDLTFRLEEAVGQALEDKVLLAEPDPTVGELAVRLQKMVEGK